MSDRKEEIVDVAKQLFAEYGIRQTTVREIGAKAGILSGSLYHHFSSKDDLVDYILKDFCADVLAHYVAICESDLPSADKLRDMARYAFSLLDEHPAEITIVADEYLYSADVSGAKSTRYAYISEFNQSVGRRWYDVLESGVASGEFSPTLEPRVLYRLVRDAIMGATRWWVPSKGMGATQIADALVHVVLQGIVVKQD
jgi:AcrR family transcriptional regulator